MHAMYIYIHTHIYIFVSVYIYIYIYIYICIYVDTKDFKLMYYLNSKTSLEGEHNHRKLSLPNSMHEALRNKQKSFAAAAAVSVKPGKTRLKLHPQP